VAAGDLREGDVLERVQLPEPERPRDCAIDNDAAWLAGLYLAEGSMADDTIQIAGHAKEEARWDRVCAIAAKYGGSATRTVDGNNMAIRIYGKVLRAILAELVTGHTAKDKGFAPVVWRYSNAFLEAMMDGYLAGDGYWDADNRRWRLGFTRNYNLERDLRTACARLGWHLVLNLASVPYKGRDVPTFRGELRCERSGHHNEKPSTEVVAINKARCRAVYDVGVAGEPHLFALASGVLTHNSKPNPMPESVTDRPTKAHEYLFLLTKRATYFYDAEAVREKTSYPAGQIRKPWTEHKGRNKKDDLASWASNYGSIAPENGRNRRSVWTIATEPYPEAHFATYPTALVKPCILAGTSERGVCPVCGAPWVRVIEKGLTAHDGETASQYPEGTTANRLALLRQAARERGEEYVNTAQTIGWRPSCTCGGDPVPATVLDPFCGSGTTGLVALTYGRNFIGIDLSPEYLAMAERRIAPAGAQTVLEVER
jgi:hypothetical protein